MTEDQAFAALKADGEEKRALAQTLRSRGEEYKLAANDADDVELRRWQFEESARLFGQARQSEREAEAIEIVIAAARRTESERKLA